MSHWLIKKFVKNWEDAHEPEVRTNYAKLAGTVGIFTNFLLCVMKIAIGWLASSIAIIADGVNNLTDASSSIMTLVGFKLASQPEDSEHPFGHARIEYLTGVLISVVILIVGIMLLKSSVLKVIHPEEQTYDAVTILVLVISILVKLWQCFFYRGIGKTINSLTVMAASADSRNDVITTSVVLIGVIINKLMGYNLDGLLGCGVAIFIIISGVQLVMETMSPLLGEAPDPELVNQIIRMAKSHPGVHGIHDLMVHNYGPGRIFASAHIEVDCEADMMESHDTIDNIEREVSSALGINFVIHMDPVKLHDPIIDELKVEVARALKDMDGVISFHDLRIVPGPTHTNVVFDVVVGPDCKISQEEITAHVERHLRRIDPHYFVVITFDKAYTHITEA
ncbi:MAG: cation diffusion facilitator family transporter [Eubacteriaceae bacterium]|jgi:cation diffusion facilitator family transporter|nr:cation diffusion facilitator family transporter [Eubacteriaceae bacterium]